MKIEKTCIDLLGVDRCTGCFGCQSACQQGAIRLVLNPEGFYKPMVNHDVCNYCGLCIQRCPVLAYDLGRLPDAKLPEPKVYAAWSKDDFWRLASTSGGLFSELALPVIDAGGIVVGCVWGNEWTPKHEIASTWPEVERMRGSKYVPSMVGNLYAKIIEYLKETPRGTVLFAGTPCQVAALDLSLNREQRKRVLLIDIICDGVPSLRVFHSYLRELFKGEQVVSYMFREKSFGWGASSIRAETSNLSCYHVKVWDDPFIKGSQVYRLYQMDACDGCLFARLPRPGDITLGDYWGCPDRLNDNKGVSVVLANTQAGQEALDWLISANRIFCEPTDLVMATKFNQRLIHGNYVGSENRQAFLNGLIAGKKFNSLKKKYYPKHISKWKARWVDFCSASSKREYVAKAISQILRKFK